MTGGGTLALVRCVTEMGMGVDVCGLDDTLAATRAIFDAMHHTPPSSDWTYMGQIGNARHILDADTRAH
jgi:hypothetical protein